MKRISLSFYILFWLLTRSVPVLGQAGLKPTVKPGDYKLWHTLSDEKMAPTGKWLSYTFDYETGNDTLFLQQVKTGKRQVFPNTANAAFTTDGKYWAAIDTKGLLLINLKSGKNEVIYGIKEYSFTPDGKYIMAEKETAGTKSLYLRNLTTSQTHTLEDIQAYAINPAGNKIACTTTKGALLLVGLDGFKQATALENTGKKLIKPTWNDTGTTLAFMEELLADEQEGTPYKLGCIPDTSNPSKTTWLDAATFTQGLQGRSIVRAMADVSLFVSNEGHVFFYTAKRTIKETNELPEIWDASDPLTYTARKAVSGWHAQWLTAWSPKEGKVMQIGDAKTPGTLLCSGYRYALGYDMVQYEPHYDLDAPSDFYTIDLHTGHKTLALQKQERKVRSIFGSPKGNFITYFKDRHWWVYDIAKGTGINLTKDTGVNFYEEDYDEAGEPGPYDALAWSADEKYIIAYDRYDIWLLGPDGSSRQKITSGRENGISFRVDLQGSASTERYGFSVAPVNVLDFSNGLILQATGDDKATGYYTWHPQKGLSQIAYKNARLSHLQKVPGGFMYREESFAVPPTLVFVKVKKVKPQLLVQSNPHFKKYAWGKSQLLHYQSRTGVPLQAALFYPAGYEPGKKYPMVVQIYERESYVMHWYDNPSDTESGGVSRTAYTQDGYMVMFADIAYELGSPGKSATDCVLAAVDAAIKTGVVDEKRIGLIGGSFGGFETAFIISQTNRFAAAVSGCAYTDMVSWYLSMKANSGRSNMWRFEAQQQRMRKTLYENYEGYVNNSPIRHAQNINTPLLSWSGKEDLMVNWRQGMQLHLALRRLGKKNIFLIYPGQGHAFKDSEPLKDLNNRIMQWFDHYLKNESPADRIKQGIK